MHLSGLVDGGSTDLTPLYGAGFSSGMPAKDLLKVSIKSSK